MVRLLIKNRDIVIAALRKMNGSTETKDASSNNNDWIVLGDRGLGHFFDWG